MDKKEWVIYPFFFIRLLGYIMLDFIITATDEL